MAEYKKGDKVKVKRKDGTSEELTVSRVASSGYLVAMGADGEDICVRQSDGQQVEMSYCSGQEPQ